MLIKINCNLTLSVSYQVNEILGVGDLATQTLAQGNAAPDASLTSVNTAITAIVAKINEILQKSTLSC